MRTSRIAMILLGLLFAMAMNVSLAQDTTSSGKSKAKVRTITGCLAQGSGSNSYVLNGSDGSTWNLKSDSVALADHVGHSVTVKGAVSNVTMHNAKEEAKDAAAGAGMKNSNNETGDLDVTSLKMVSKSCK
ncbi:MAG: hypothetical protein WBR26_07065 [Candidatus Acidiferrum sp.]